MRVAASLLAVLAACSVQGASAQSADRAQQPTATTTQPTPKSAASPSTVRPGASTVNARGAGDAAKAKPEGVSTMPASDSKKGSSDCHHGLASDA